MSDARHADHAVDDLFLARWSPRAFAEARMDEAALLAILEAARWAPSSLNIQPWRFVYGLKGEPGFDALLAALAPTNAAWAKDAAALVAIASARQSTPAQGGAPVPNAKHAFDTGAAWGFLALQAQLAGWHSHAMGGFDAAKAAAAVALPADHEIHAIVAIGRRGAPESLPDALRARERPSQRRPLAETAFKGRFPA